jgi:hypothetical protein
MLQIDEVHIREWSKWWRPHAPSSAVKECEAYKTTMTDDEKTKIDNIIAETQYAEDPAADTTDAAIVLQTLTENGFHPAFEFTAIISGQKAFEDLRAARQSPQI